MNYYNDNDPKACAWLRELIAAGELPAGDVDERSILEIKADELGKYDQCNFFAGVGGWPLALRWAGLEGVPGIWTGSCPCQPFSCAGRGKGTEDERHLWPVFRDLIRACRPAVVFGEQVASAAVVGAVGARACAEAGTVWLDGVRGDMESAGYAFGAAVLGAHSVGAPHRRQRLYWVADAEHNGGRADEPGRKAQGGDVDGRACRMGDAEGRGCGVGGDAAQQGCGGHADGTGWAGDASGGMEHAGHGAGCAMQGHKRHTYDSGSGQPGAWDDCILLPCRDGKARRIPAEPALFPLAHGLPGRVGLLRGAGNAIVPQVAEVFVRAWMETQNLSHHAEPRFGGDSVDGVVGSLDSE